MQNGEAPNYPEPLAKAIRAAEQAVADAVDKIGFHERAVDYARRELECAEKVLAAYTHAVTVMTESAPISPAEPAKTRRPRRDIVAMVREHIAGKGYVDHGDVATALGIRPSQAANALIKISQEKARAEEPS